MKHFSYSLCPDELFLQTIILNSPFATNVINNNCRYTEWDQSSAHPRILTVADFDKISSADKLFARKFDPTLDAAILDLIDQKLLN